MSNFYRKSVEEVKKEEQFPFFRWLMKEKKFQNLSAEAKLLFCIFKDTEKESLKNKWFDDNNNVYIHYKVDTIKKELNCGKDKALKIKKELKDVGLIEEIRQGVNQPNIIYVNEYYSDDYWSSEKQKSGSRKNRTPNLEVGKTEVRKSENQNLLLNECMNDINIQSFSDIDVSEFSQFHYYADGSVKQYLTSKTVDDEFQKFLNSRSKPYTFQEIVNTVKLLEEFSELIQFEMISQSLKNEWRKIIQLPHEKIELLTADINK